MEMFEFLTIFLSVVGVQTTLLIAIFGFMWKHFNSRFDKMEDRLTRLEHDMIEVKTILRMKECCMIQDDSQLKKAE